MGTRPPPRHAADAMTSQRNKARKPQRIYSLLACRGFRSKQANVFISVHDQRRYGNGSGGDEGVANVAWRSERQNSASGGSFLRDANGAAAVTQQSRRRHTTVELNTKRDAAVLPDRRNVSPPAGVQRLRLRPPPAAQGSSPRPNSSVWEQRS